jgi:hypothetical protein
MLTNSIPIAAQKLLKAIEDCTEVTVWTTDEDGAPATYLHPKGRIVFNGLIKPDDPRPGGGKWVGESPMYLIVYHHPLNAEGNCDAHWFAVDVLEVAAEQVVEQKLLE